MRTVTTTLGMVGLLLGLGCGVTPSEPAVEQRAAMDDPLDDLRVRPPDRGKVRGGERMRRTVQWPADGVRDLGAYEGFDARSQAAIDAAPVPVLVPAPAVALDQRQVMHGPEWYAFWGQRGGDEGTTVTVTLQGSRMARVHPGVRPQAASHALRGQPAWVTRNEGIWSASFIEHGVAYDLGIECAPVDAPPCHDATELEALAEGLRYVGGDARAAETRDEEVVR
jgi:hypothetical protein